jgi:GT2 family glycosyltransferase
MDEHRLLIISPVRNEAAHIGKVAAGLAAQTRRPDLWLVVDDGSDDGTPAILAALAEEHDFMRVVATPPDFTAQAADRLAVAAAPRAFNYGLGTLTAAERDSFTHLGKLDGDIELVPNYFETVLAEFDQDPRLGISGGAILEQRDGDWRAVASATEHVRGALKLYSRACFEAIGGIREVLAWDAVDEVIARMKGFETRSIPTVEALHHRHTGTADGRLRGHVRWGRGHWIAQHGPVWTLVRSVKVGATLEPRGVSGVAYLYGYASAAVRRVPRCDVDGYRGFIKAEHRRRIVARLHPSRPVGGPATGSNG